MKHSIPLTWRRIPERYRLLGSTCSHCNTKYFPKRIVCPKCRRKGKEFFIVINIPADRILDWKKAKKALQANDCRLAQEHEVKEKTNCEVGGVPPLGDALPILADPKIFNEKTLEFNAGLKTKSIRVESNELKKVFDRLGVAYFDFVKE